MLEPMAAKKGLVFEMSIADDVPTTLKGDASHLRQILINLAFNAVKFTEAGSVRVLVSRVGAESDGRMIIRFAVRDTGIGIPDEARERIFQAFEQVEGGHARRFGGTGLGTTIAKALSESMGGRIDFDSEFGKGSEFRADIPLLVVGREASPAGISPADGKVIHFDDPFVRHRARVRSLRLLIADDQAANLTVLRRLLEKAGHQVWSVDSGEEVLNAIEMGGYDAVITDLHMPGVSGLDVLKQARVMEAGRRLTPFIVFSADATEQARKIAATAGAVGFLTKPIVVTRLLDVLAEIAQGDAAGEMRPASRNDGAEVISPHFISELAGMGLDPPFVELFINECLNDAVKCIVAIERAVADDNRDTLREHCHALKGVAGNMGATQLAATVSECMNSDPRLRAGDLQAVPARLREQLEAARAALRGMRDAVPVQHTPDNA